MVNRQLTISGCRVWGSLLRAREAGTMMLTIRLAHAVETQHLLAAIPSSYHLRRCLYTQPLGRLCTLHLLTCLFTLSKRPSIHTKATPTEAAFYGRMTFKLC
jgi:hypothetical protein